MRDAAQSVQKLLTAHGVRVTAPRVALLAVLLQETLPRAIEYLRSKTNSGVDKVTAYRTLEAFVAAGLVRRVELGHDHAHYELIPGRPHHHHVVCTDCGLIEDIVVPHVQKPESVALKASQKFSSVDSYSFEFFGRCSTCA